MVYNGPKPLYNKGLGVLELTNHFETRVLLTKEKSCTIKPNLLDPNNLQLTLSLELKSPTGQMQNLSIVQLTTKPSQPVEVVIGDWDLTLTPQMAAE